MSRPERTVALLAAVQVLAACSLARVDLDAQRPLALRSTIVAADGTVLARLYKHNRAYVPLERVPQPLVDAVVAAEDARFFEHGGFDLRATARAALVNVRSGRVVQGGSTITQQYVKNTYFTRPGRTLARKVRELRLALEVEERLSKRDILERYLNTVYFGEGAYGVKAAAEAYFHRGVRKLSLPQAALLAALIRAPSAYDPRTRPRVARIRRNHVLQRMAELGALSEAMLRRSLRAGLGVAPDPPRTALRHPYFVEAVRQEVLRDQRLGATRDERERQLREGGLRVETTLAPRLQQAAEAAVAGVLNQPGDPEAALVAIRARRGEIVAMVGGRDWSSSQVNLALGAAGGGSGRQAGSAFKPIVAAAALQGGIRLSDRYDSAPTTFEMPGADPWVVHNAEGHGYGLMPLDEALVRSVNAVYARLGLQLGAGAIVRQAELMGITSKLSPVPSIALGSEEVSVVDMASAYATLANHGTAITPTTISRIELPDGQVLEARPRTGNDVVEPGNAYLLTRVLQDVIERGTGTAADIGRPAAGKTGTTNDYADAWFVGYTPRLVAAVWVGYPHSNVSMTSVHGIRVTGGSFPALIWRDFMARALEGAPVEDFTVPDSEYVTVEIDPRSGLLATSWCPGRPVTMLRQVVPTEVCPPPPPSPSPSPSPSRSPTPSPSPSPTPSRSPSPTPSPAADDAGRDDADKAEPEPSPEPTRS